MRRPLAHAAFALALTSCGSDPLTPPGAADSGGASGTHAGAAGDANDTAGFGGESSAGAPAASGAAGDAGTPGTSGENGDGGSPTAPVIGYRLAGIAYGTFPNGEGGAAGASDAANSDEGGTTGSASPDVSETGAAGAPVELSHIDRAECNFYLDFVDVVEDETGGFEAFAIGEIFRAVYAGERRWEFSAFLGGPASFVVNDDGSAELRAFGD